MGHHVDKGGPMEAVIVVCDRADGRPAAESIRFKLGSRSLQLDLCDRHLRELAAGAHPVKRGRQRSLNGATSATDRKSAGRKTAGPKKAGPKKAGQKTAGQQSTGRKTTGNRRGRPPGSK